MAKRVSSEDFEAEVLGSDLPVVVEFYSDSCIPCNSYLQSLVAWKMIMRTR